MPATIQCMKPWASGSVTVTAYAAIGLPSVRLTSQRSGGETSCPSHVNLAGIRRPTLGNAGLSNSLNGGPPFDGGGGELPIEGRGAGDSGVVAGPVGVC